jgi:hypothetical protein
VTPAKPEKPDYEPATAEEDDEEFDDVDAVALST